MGKSKSIEQQLKEDKKNRELINELELELAEKCKESEATINQKIQEFYEGGERNWKFAPFVNGSQSSYQLSDTWSLDTLSNLIDTISDIVIGSVTGDQTKLPEGTQVSDESNEINKTAGLTKDM